MEPAEGPAPPDPTTAPAEPAAAPAPEPAAEPAPPVPDFRPTWARRYIVAPFWAGLLGGGVLGWIFPFFIFLFQAEILKPRHEWFAVGFIFIMSIGVALWRGYLDPIRSYASLFGRILGAVFFGGVCLAIAVAIFMALPFRDSTMFLVMSLSGAFFAGLALRHLYGGLGTERPRRIKIGVAAAGVLLFSLFATTPAFRCRLGGGEACADVAAELSEKGEHADAAEYGERGCDRGFAAACTVAGIALQRGAGPRKDQVGAERLFRRGCALGDDVACKRVHGIELDRRCAHYSAFACKELAEDYARGAGVDRDQQAAMRYRQKACLLGDEDACQR